MSESESESESENVYVFIHGYGSSPLDLDVLKRSFIDAGHECVSLRLAGHHDGTDIADANYGQWKRSVEELIEEKTRDNRKVFIIGFSLGATLTLDVSSDKALGGIAGISTFFGTTKTLDSLANILRYFFSNVKRKVLPRLINTTKRETKKNLVYDKFLPPSGIFEILHEAKRVWKTSNPQCPVLLIHSINDKIANYDLVAKYSLKSDQRYLVTLRKLGHFLQFDMSPNRIRDLILDYFDDEIDSLGINEDQVAEEIRQIHNEHNEWAGMIFKLVVSYITAIGVLLYFSLEKVLSIDAESSPYYLIAYAIFTNIYLTLVILYFFFLNRSSAYIRHFLEPLVVDSVGYSNYKSNSFLSGKQSASITAATSIGILWIPLGISLSSLICTVYLFPGRILELEASNILLQSMLLISAITYLFVLWSLTGFAIHSRNELRRVPVSNHIRPRTIRKLMKLYRSIRPAFVDPMD